MKTLAFSEHSGIMEWYHKKKALESAGMKYVHAIEAYLTTTLSEKIRDNYPCVLIAKNYDGFWELNRLVSQSFNRADNHFYYVPRISFDEPVWTRWNEYPKAFKTDYLVFGQMLIILYFMKK